MLEFRSDTFTLPTPEMLDAAREAQLGNEGYREDPTVKQLERLAAVKLGKEAALFVPSGTMGNLVAILTHCNFDESAVLVGDCSDIFIYETKSTALVANLEIVPLGTQLDGTLKIEDIERAFDQNVKRSTRIRLLCLENPHNMRGGRIIPTAYIFQAAEIAHSHAAKMHLDGARIFHAAVALRCDVSQIVEAADSVQFCMSKGLAAPVGSILTGTQDFIERARSIRKALGGTMRQAGLVAAPGIVALNRMVDRLAEDHVNALRFGDGLRRIPGIDVDLDTIQTNTVTFRVSDPRFDMDLFIATAWKKGVHLSSFEDGSIRAVTHYGITASDVDCALQILAELMNSGPEKNLLYTPYPDG